MSVKVSVLTPCYNGEKYVKRYFESLLNQTYTNFEIVFVNDGSKDKTEEIALDYKKKFKKKNINFKYIYQENKGQAAACNNGLKHVEGEYLVWPDSDDYYEKDAIEVLVKSLDNNPDCSYTRGKVVYRDEETLEPISYMEPHDKNKTNLFEDYMLINDNVMCFAGIIMIRVKDFEIANDGREIIDSRGGQNWQFVLPITYNRKGAFVDKVVYNYLVRNNSHSHSIKGRKMKIQKIYELEKLLTSIIQNMKMSEEEKTKYIAIVKKRYKKERINVYKRYNLIYKFLAKIKNRLVG